MNRRRDHFDRHVFRVVGRRERAVEGLLRVSAVDESGDIVG